VIASGALAFANARIRARKSQLLGGDARRAAGSDIRSAVNFVSCCEVVLDALPGSRAVVRALVERHEIENVKLVWRALVRGRSSQRWSPLWRRLEPLATFALDQARDCASLNQFVDRLHATPHREIAAAMWRGHRNDLLAAELGFDRWMSRRLLDAGDALDARETIARALIGSVVGERDLQLLRRGVATYKLAPDAVAGALTLAPRVMSAASIATAAAWQPEHGGFAGLWPRAWRTAVAGAADWNTLLLRWRQARYRLCCRAFLGNPFSFAPAIALLLLVDEDARGVTALAETHNDGSDAASLEFALAASAMGH
jgi:hypothetical protein